MVKEDLDKEFEIVKEVINVVYCYPILNRWILLSLLVYYHKIAKKTMKIQIYLRFY